MFNRIRGNMGWSFIVVAVFFALLFLIAVVK